MSDWTVIKSQISNLLQPGATNSTSVPDIRNSLYMIIDQINGPDQNHEDDVWKPDFSYPQDIQPVLYRDRWLVSNIAGNEGNEPINSGGMVHGSWRVVNVSAKSVIKVWQTGVYPNLLELVFYEGQLYYLDRDVVGTDVFSSLDFEAELAEDPSKWKAIGILDEEDLASNSPVKAASQRSVKTYVDALETAINENLAVDDEDYDTRQKIVNEIRSNDTDIEDLYEIKANKADIINDLTTNDPDKIAGADTAFLLKNLIDALGVSINNNLSVDDPAYNTRQKIVNEIKSNDADIADLYNIKANKADIVDNLVTDNPSKIASSNTAFLLKNLIDGILDNLSVDDPAYDTRQELLNFLKSNKALITALQADKINFTDIADNFITNDPSKVASANTVVLLKGMIDNIQAVLASDDTALDEFQELVNFIKQNKEDLNTLTIANIAGLQAALDSKVDKIGGKGLSTNDLTNTLLTNYNFAHSFASTFSIADYHAALDGRYFTETEINNFFSGATGKAGYNKSNWDNAYQGEVTGLGFDPETGELTIQKRDENLTENLDDRYLKIVDTPTSGTIGELVFYSGATPNGVTLADGRAVDRVGVYADLFALYGTTYGAGNGTTTFNLPDFRGRSVIGSGTGAGLTARTVGQTGGQESITDIPSHSHEFKVSSGVVTTVSNPSGKYLSEGKSGAFPANIYADSSNGTLASEAIGTEGVASVDVMNPFSVVHIGIRFSVQGNSNEGILAPNSIVGTDALGDLAVIALGDNLSFAGGTLSVRHPETSDQDTVLLGGASVFAGIVLDENGHITSLTTRNLLPPNIGAEPAIGTKGTAFNDDYGMTAGTVAEGNDSRIVNGQTAYDWGDWKNGGTMTGSLYHRSQYHGTAFQILHSTGGVLTIDFNNGNMQSVKLQSNVTSITLVNVRAATVYNIAFEQDATGGRTVNFPTAWHWRGSEIDSITSTSEKWDILTLATFHSSARISASLAKDYGGGV